MNYEITPAQTKDAFFINALINDSYRGEASKLGWTNEIDIIGGNRMDEIEVHRMIDNPKGMLFKCTYNEQQIIGCGYIELQGKELYLGTLTVSPAFQAKGIGKLMLKYADHYALKNNCSEIVIDVVSERTELMNWYIRHDYHLNGEIKPFPSEKRFGTPLKIIHLMVLKKRVSSSAIPLAL